MTERKKKQIGLRLDGNFLKMLEELQAEFNLENRTTAIEFSIGFFHTFWPCSKVFSDMLAQKSFQRGEKVAIQQSARISAAFADFVTSKHQNKVYIKRKKEAV